MFPSLASDQTLDLTAQLIGEGERGPIGSDPPPPPQLAPSIDSFGYQIQWGLYQFHGSVLDDKPTDGLTVHFGGVLDGQSATVDANGHFELIIALPSGTTGEATAQTTDADGLTSNIANVQID